MGNLIFVHPRFVTRRLDEKLCWFCNAELVFMCTDWPYLNLIKGNVQSVMLPFGLIWVFHFCHSKVIFGFISSSKAHFEDTITNCQDTLQNKNKFKSSDKSDSHASLSVVVPAVVSVEPPPHWLNFVICGLTADPRLLCTSFSRTSPYYFFPKGQSQFKYFLYWRQRQQWPRL